MLDSTSILRTSASVAFGLAALGALVGPAFAADGPLGIDHRVNLDDRGIWARHNQVALEEGVILLVVGGALWEGDDTRLGHALWQSFDSMAMGAVSAEGLKYAFSRSRPSQTDNPNQWFQGHGHKSFPSGEVMTVTTVITPVVLEYGNEYPAVWALELLPTYDAVARVKARAHWQSDVLASFVVGTAIGAYAHSRTSSISVGVLPHGLTVGWKKTF